MLLRFVQGPPVSRVTEDFLSWIWERLAAEGSRNFLLVWDNAVGIIAGGRDWICAHNRRAKRYGEVLCASWLALADREPVALTASSPTGSTANAPSSKPSANSRGRNHRAGCAYFAVNGSRRLPNSSIETALRESQRLSRSRNEGITGELPPRGAFRQCLNSSAP